MLHERTNLLKEWDESRNFPLTPDTVSYGSKKKVWWTCENGHSWQTTVHVRSEGSGCPYCTGRKVLPGFNDLGTLYPDVAARVREAVAAGVDLCGENRVQELTQKLAQNAYDGVPVHFIGHLQTNKIKKVLGRASLIQSVDSEHLLAAIEKEAARAGLVQNVLLEVNIGGEASKSGVSPEQLWPLLDTAAAQEHIRVCGLMAIPPVNDDDARNRAYLAAAG